MGGDEMKTPLNKLEQRILQISYKKGLSHLGSCLTSVRIIDQIYQVKKENEPFILDNSHSALALYVIIEKVYFKNAEKLFDKHGVHANRDMNNKIWSSGGSLGHNIGIGVGMALANSKRNAWVLTSDGAMNEGSNWEALRIAGELRLENLRVFVNANGYGAYSRIDVDLLEQRMNMFYPCIVFKTNMFKYPDYLNGLESHYHVLTKEEYEEIAK